MGLGFEKIANLEINLLYRLARAMDIILRDCEKNLELQKSSFHREKKKTFNELMASNPELRYSFVETSIKPPCSLFLIIISKWPTISNLCFWGSEATVSKYFLAKEIPLPPKFSLT